jgi:hypothetical protein
MIFTRGQIIAVIIGSMMFLPGLCFLAFGFEGALGDSSGLLFTGLVILGIVGALAYYAFHRPPKSE